MRAIAYLGNDTLLTMTKYERKIYVDDRDLGIAPHILMQGDWEHWISNFAQKFLLDWARREGAKPESPPWVLDVGANVGWYSLLAHFTAEGHFQVKAYEPNPRMAELLRMTFSVNGLPVDNVRRVCVGDCPRDNSQQIITWTSKHPGGGSILPSEGPELAGEPELPAGTLWSKIEQVDLDSELPDGAPVALIKIDVEGAEPAVLRGAAHILKDNPRCGLLVEHNPSDEETAVLRMLIGQGYQLGWVGYDSNLHVKTVDEAIALPETEMLFLQKK